MASPAGPISGDLTDLERWGLEEGFTTLEEIASERDQRASGLPHRPGPAPSVPAAGPLAEGAGLGQLVEDWRRRAEPSRARRSGTGRDEVGSDTGLPSRRELLDFVRDHPRKFEPEDLTDPLRELATSYARSYRGDFEWMLDQRRRLRRYGSLLDGGLKGVLNVLRAELHRRATAAGAVQGGASEPGVDVHQVPAIAYAVTGGEGKVAFYRVEHGEGRWAGWTFLRQVVGGREPVRVGAVPPGQLYRGDRRAHLEEIARDPRGASERYGRELGVCGICGRTLTDEESRAAGVGPVCAERMGWDRGVREES